MNATRFAVVLAFILFALAAILFLHHYGEKPRLVIEPACSPKPVNPCATMRCEVKFDPRSIA